MGIFSVPYGIKEVGLIGGFFCIVITLMMCIFINGQLIETINILGGTKLNTLGAICGRAFKN